MDKVLRAFSVGIVLFAAIIAIIVGQRIDQNTVSLLSGAMIGVLVAAPCAGLVAFIAARRRENNNQSGYERSIRHGYQSGYQLPPNPPQYWVLPQQFQTPQAVAAGMNAAGWPGSQEQMQYLPRPRRRFFVIGENGEPKPLENEAVNDASYPFDPDEAGAAF